jgi:hypothetical protein
MAKAPGTHTAEGVAKTPGTHIAEGVAKAPGTHTAEGVGGGPNKQVIFHSVSGQIHQEILECRYF